MPDSNEDFVFISRYIRKTYSICVRFYAISPVTIERGRLERRKRRLECFYAKTTLRTRFFLIRFEYRVSIGSFGTKLKLSC